MNKKLNDLLMKMPYFMRVFFIGVESNTSISTRLNYARDMEIFFNFLILEIPEFSKKRVEDLAVEDLELIKAEHIENFLNYLNYYDNKGKIITNSNRTKARKLASIRAVLKYFFNKDEITKNVATKIRTPKIKEKEIIRLEYEETNKMLDAIENGSEILSKKQNYYRNKNLLRDKALILLFLGTGIRISEAVGLNIGDIDFLNNAFTITRKGGNRVILYFNDEIKIALNDYLMQRDEKEELKKDTPLFISLKKSRITVRAVENLVKKYAQCSNPLKKITPHKLRSTYGTNLYRETGDIYLVAEVLGHKDVNTTKRYYASISDDMRKKAGKNFVIKK